MSLFNRFYLLVSVMFFTSSLQAQTTKDALFRYPLDSLPHFISPFGAIRENHFHSGVDLKTQEREGLPVYAAESGYISRIKIAANGYGKAIYIDHPNGFSTVYGHLQSFKEPFASWIKNVQYAKQQFAFDSILTPGMLLVNKGDTLGLSGNSGGSTGPHLHFEIRESKTEETWNTGLFGILPADTLNPFLNTLHFYQFVPEGILLEKRIDDIPKKIVFNDTDSMFGNMYKYSDTIHLIPDMYGIGIEAFDYIHNKKETKGVYQFGLIYHLEEIFKFKLNKFAFSETKFVNHHVDYPWFKIKKEKIQKCFIDDGNKFSQESSHHHQGKFFVKANQLDSIVVFIGDINDNMSFTQFYIWGDTSIASKQKTDYFKRIQNKPIWKPNHPFNFEASGFSLNAIAHATYDTIYFDFEQLDGLKNSYASVYKIHQPYTAIQQPIQVAIECTQNNVSSNTFLCLASVGKNNELRYAGGTNQNGWVKGSIGNFGNYTIAADSIAPTAIWSKSNQNDTIAVRIVIDDNFSGIANYALYLNNNWVLADYDAKNNLLSYLFDEVYDTQKLNTAISPKANWKLVLIDKQGNRSEFNWQSNWK